MTKSAKRRLKAAWALDDCRHQNWRHMLGGVGFVDAQVAELLAVVDALLEPAAESAQPSLNGIGQHGAAGGDGFTGSAATSWRTVHESTSAQHARLSAHDDVLRSLLAAVHERAGQTRQHLTTIRADLVDLTHHSPDAASTRAEKIDTVELVQAKARELQKLTLEAQRFSGEMAGKLRVAAATYSD